MSFAEQKSTIEDGDTVMLYLGRQSLMTIQINGDKIHQTKFGAFPHKDFIGKAYGTKMYSKNRRGWVYLLHPTPELWTVTLPHRTQILYSTDISLITLELELKPGSVVVESGTGSGSLSHAIIRTIKPNGHLYTFDFHEQRVEKAREEFQSHGIGEYVTCGHADACKDGFNMENKADAVFLDLPAPWDAIPHATRALKKSGGRICSFSPCIEQVQRTCDALRKYRFCEIKTVECLVRNINVRTMAFPEVNLGPKNLDIKKTSHVPTPQNENGQPESKKSKLDCELENHDSNDLLPVVQNQESSIESELATVESQSSESENISGVNSIGMVSKLTSKAKLGNVNVLTAKSNKEMPGHTGYLTFASLYPYLKQESEE